MSVDDLVALVEAEQISAAYSDARGRWFTPTELDAARRARRKGAAPGRWDAQVVATPTRRKPNPPVTPMMDPVPSPTPPVPHSADATDSGMLKTAEVAKMFRVESQTVANWANEGRFTCIRTPGGQRRYIRREVQALRSQILDRRVVEPREMQELSAVPRDGANEGEARCGKRC